MSETTNPSDTPAPTSRPPRYPGDFLADGFCWLFAAWTLLCHWVVVTDGSLRDLLWLTGGGLVGWAILRFSLRSEPRVTEVLAVPSSPMDSWPRTSLRDALVALLPPLVIVTLGPWVGVTTSWWLAVVYLGAHLTFQLRAKARSVRSEVPAEPIAERHRVAFWLIALAALTVTVVAQRVDSDDTYYLNIAVNAADWPDRELLCCDTLHGVDGLEISHSTHRLRSLEILQGALSFITGIPAIHWTHRGLPILGALLLVAGYARLFRILAPERWLPCLAVTLLMFVFVANTHLWYGNMAFVRLHQGKAIFASAILPLVMAYGLELGRDPTWRRCALLAAAQVTAVGMNPTALWVAPAAASLAVVAGAVWSRRTKWALLLGAASSLYLVGWALILRPSMLTLLKISVRGRTSLELMDIASGAVIGDGTLAVVTGLAGLLAWWSCRPGPGRFFCLVLPFGFLLFLFSPYLAKWIAGNATSQYVYWRVFWVLPVPALIALCLTAPLGFRLRGLPRSARRAVTLVALAAFGLLVVDEGTLSEENGTRLKPFSLRVNRLYETAALMVRMVPPRSMVVAPAGVSAWVVTFHHHPFPLMARKQYLRGDLGTDEEVARRKRMTDFVGRTKVRPAELTGFLSDLDATEDLWGVCFRRRLAMRKQLAKELKRRGFECLSRKSFEIWVRRLPPQAPADPGAPANEVGAPAS